VPGLLRRCQCCFSDGTVLADTQSLHAAHLVKRYHSANIAFVFRYRPAIQREIRIVLKLTADTAISLHHAISMTGPIASVPVTILKVFDK